MIAISSILRPSLYLLLLLICLPGFDAQTYTTTTSYWSTQYYASTLRTNSYNCGRNVFNNSIGNITSPNYPKEYSSGQFCNYFVVAPSLSTINFSIFIIYVEPQANCNYDWIEFTCQTNSISRTIRYCGSDNRTQLTFKPCSRVLVRFVSDSAVAGLGFFVSYDIKPISCQGNCTPVAVGAGYNCTCDANQTDPYIAPPYDQCPNGCYLTDMYPSSSPLRYCVCNYFVATSPPPPTVPPCPDSCYSYTDGFGYPVCYCNASSTTSATVAPLECPYGCYIGLDGYGYPICHCEGTTQSTPCPFGCYNVTYSYGYSYCDCSSPQSTTPLTFTCPTGCSPDRDYWETPYCRCNSSYSASTVYPTYSATPPPCYYPCYYQDDFYGNPHCICTTNNGTSSPTACNYPCYYDYDGDDYNSSYCSCGLSTTVTPCYYPCYYDYDYYGQQYCSCNETTNNGTSNSTDIPCNYPCYYDHDYYGKPYCSCASTTTQQPCYRPCRYEYDNYGRQYCSCNSTNSCDFPCYYGHDSDWNYTCICNTSTTAPSTTTPSPGCNVTQYKAMGTLMSPNYPNTYPANIDCVQTITVLMANTIQLMFLDLNVFYSSSDNCLYEYVEITGCDGSVRQYCAFNSSLSMPIEFICTDSYTVTVRFHSYYYNYYYNRGFKLNYRSTFGSSCNSTGGLVSLGSRGSIVSPNYPNNYPLSNECYYVLQAAESHAIRIRVAFELLMMQDSPGCSLEFIRLNCLDGSDSPWFVCGNRIPSPLTFNCSSVEIRFHSQISSDDRRAPKLFRIVYYGVEGPAFGSNVSVSSADSLRSRLGSSGAGVAGLVLLPLAITLGMKTSD